MHRGISAGRHEAREMKVLRQARRRRFALCSSSRRMPSPMNRKRTLSIGLDHLAGGANDILVPFQMKQPGDFADDDVLRLIAQVALASARGARRRAETARHPCRYRSS